MKTIQLKSDPFDPTKSILIRLILVRKLQILTHLIQIPIGWLKIKIHADISLISRIEFDLFYKITSKETIQVQRLEVTLEFNYQRKFGNDRDQNYRNY